MRADLRTRLEILLKLTEAPAILVNIDAHDESFRDLLRDTLNALDARAGFAWGDFMVHGSPESVAEVRRLVEKA